MLKKIKQIDYVYRRFRVSVFNMDYFPSSYKSYLYVRQ